MRVSGGPARHEMPAIDAAALAAARHADRLLAAAWERGAVRWVEFLEAMPDRLRDGDPRELRSTARRARSAFGPKDSIRDVLPNELTEPFRDAVDLLLKELARREVGH